MAVDPRGLPTDARRRVHRAVLFGERLSNPKERRAAVIAARRWRQRPVRTALPMVVAVAGLLAVAWGALAMLRPAWAEDALTPGGVVGSALGVLLGCGIMIGLQWRMARRAEELNADRRSRSGNRSRRK